MSEGSETSRSRIVRLAEPAINDEAVKRATGRDWDEWVVLLDDWGAATRPHREIASYLSTDLKVPDWWSQGVTIGYERIRGMRAPNQHNDGFSVSVNKTFQAGLDTVFDAFADRAKLDRWVGPDVLRIRGTTPGKSVRYDVFSDGSRATVLFTRKSDVKTAVSFEHLKLASADDVEIWRAFWKTRFDALAATLTQA